MVAGFVSLLLVRHGQSEWNAIRRWQGLENSPLTDLGRRQAADVCTALTSLDHRFQSVWASPLARAAETAEIIASGLGLAPPTTDERLRESDAGEWQGMTPDEIEAAYPDFLANHRRPPTFEPFDEVVRRARLVLADVAAMAEPGRGSVIVATHSGVIRSLVRDLGARDQRIPNLGGVWLSVVPGSSVTEDSVRLDLRGRFDPRGVVRTGVDVPGEDPGDQPDHPETHRGTQR